MSARLPPQFPLAWPDDWQRTTPRLRVTSSYKVGAPRAYDLIEHELDNWSVIASRGLRGYPSRRLWVVTSNMQSRLAGKPNGEGKAPSDDPGVAVWWTLRDGEAMRVVACDTWSTVAQNLRACGVIIESLRAMERAGASQALARTEAGLVAMGLPAPRPWWRELLDLPDTFTAEDVERAYKRGALRAHPDQGGTHEAFVQLQRAREEALAHVTRASRHGWEPIRGAATSRGTP